MKRFLFFIALFFAIVCVVDFGFGKAVDKLCSTAKDGEKSKIYYIANRMDEDVVIMGSSRAYRHYVPYVLEDTLKKSVYNAGCSNMGIVCNYGLYKAFKKIHTPKMIIYEVYYTDFATGDITTYLDNLRLLKNDKDIYEYIAKLSPDDKWKMKSSLYCYNTKWIYIIQENIKSSMTLEKGYAPDKGKLSYKPDRTPNEYTIDSLKVRLFKEFVKEVSEDHTSLVITVSPLYYGDDFSWIAWAREIASEYNIPFYDYSKDDSFLENNNLFYDQIHLNEEGAISYTKKIAHKLTETTNTIQ